MSVSLVGTDGSAALPTSAIDPPQRAASPAVPALIGSGSPSGRIAAANLLAFRDHIAEVVLSGAS